MHRVNIGDGHKDDEQMGLLIEYAVCFLLFSRSLLLMVLFRTPGVFLFACTSAHSRPHCHPSTPPEFSQVHLQVSADVAAHHLVWLSPYAPYYS